MFSLSSAGRCVLLLTCVFLAAEALPSRLLRSDTTNVKIRQNGQIELASGKDRIGDVAKPRAKDVPHSHTVTDHQIVKIRQNGQIEHAKSNDTMVLVSEPRSREVTRYRSRLVGNSVFVGSVMGISAVASAANALVTHVRLKQMNGAVDAIGLVADNIANRKSDMCLLARTFKMEAVLVNTMVLSLVSSVESLPASTKDKESPSSTKDEETPPAPCQRKCPARGSQWNPTERKDCLAFHDHGDNSHSDTETRARGCEASGCCWDPIQNGDGSMKHGSDEPWCFQTPCIPQDEESPASSTSTATGEAEDEEGPASLAADLPDVVDAKAMADCDRTARTMLISMKVDVRLIVAQVSSSLERLVQTSCHTYSTVEQVMVENSDMLRERAKKLEEKLLEDSIKAFGEVAESVGHVAASVMEAHEAVAEASEGSEFAKSQLEWDGAAAGFTDEVSALTTTSSDFTFLASAVSTMKTALGGIGSVIVGLVTLGTRAVDVYKFYDIYKQAIELMHEGKELAAMVPTPPPCRIICVFSDLLEMTTEILEKFGGLTPAMLYVTLIMRAINNLVQLSANSIALANEKTELDRYVSQATHGSIQWAILYEKDTCQVLHELVPLAKTLNTTVASFKSALVPNEGDGTTISYNKSAAEASYKSFCFEYPSVCKGLTESLAHDTSVGAAVTSNADTIAFLAEVAPISDLGHPTENHTQHYLDMGFQKAAGFDSFMLCRGCGPDVIFGINVVPDADTLEGLKDKYAQGTDLDGKTLPKDAVLNFVSYSASHEHFAFYKAPALTVASDPSRRMLLNVSVIHVRLDDDVEDKTEWRAEIQKMLDAHWFSVLESEDKTITGSWTGAIFRWFKRSFDLPFGLSEGLGHLKQVKQHENFTALVATYLPMTGQGPHDDEIVNYDWNKAVPAGMHVPFTHVHVLRGCGCNLLFASQHAPFLESWPDDYAALKNTRVAHIFTPNEQDQKHRCGVYGAVGVYLSSQDLTSILPALPLHAKLPCTQEHSGTLPLPVQNSMEVDVAEISEDGTLTTPDSAAPIEIVRRMKDGLEEWVPLDELTQMRLGNLSLERVIDVNGDLHNIKMILLQKPVLGASPPHSVSEGGSADCSAAEVQKEMVAGGPVASFLKGLNNELCGVESTAACAFKDGRSVTEAIQFIFNASNIVPPSPSGQSEIKLDPASNDVNDHGFLKTAKLSAAWWNLFSDGCDTTKAHETIDRFFGLPLPSTLEALQTKLSGHMPLINGVADPPADLESMLDVFQDGWGGRRRRRRSRRRGWSLSLDKGDSNDGKQCDFSWYTSVQLCSSGGNGYVLANEVTGMLDHACGSPPNSSWVGPASSVMFNIMITEHLSSFYTQNQEISDALASESGFFPVHGNEWYRYKRASWEGEREAFIQSYVQVDPRLQESRAEFCPA